ncbi:MAG: hypothetical protein ACRDAP_06220, partial [Shewanella sp.]
MDLPASAASGTTVTMHLQRRIPPLQVTPANQEAINVTAQAFQPDLRDLQVGAEAITANFKVRPPGHPPEEYTYRVSGFGKGARLAIGPLSAADREKLMQETARAVSRTILDATTALTDTDTVLTTSPIEQRLVAEYGGKRVQFRRPIGAIPPPEPQLSIPQQETGYAEGTAGGQNDEVQQHNQQLKQKLFDAMRNESYHFNPDDHQGNLMKLRSPWVLYYYNGTTPTPEDLKIKLVITRSAIGAGAAAATLYGE